MKIGKVFTGLFLSLFILLPVVYSHADDIMNADRQRSVSISDEYCQVSCYDEEEDATYTVSLSGKVWMQESSPEELYCAAQIYKSVYKNGELLGGPVTALDISLDDEQVAFGGYIYHEDTPGAGASVTTRTGGIISGFFELLEDRSYLWKLLYSGYVTMTQDDENTITAAYTHRINPCPIGTYVQMHAMCDSFGTDWDEIALGCNIYEQGERSEEGDYIYGLYDTGTTIIGWYTHYIYCSASEDHSSPFFGCHGDEVYG